VPLTPPFSPARVLVEFAGPADSGSAAAAAGRGAVPGGGPRLTAPAGTSVAGGAADGNGRGSGGGRGRDFPHGNP